MLARQSHVVVSRGICCIRRAHYPKRSSFALLSGRPGGGGDAGTSSSSSSSSRWRTSTLFSPGIEAPLSGRSSFWVSSTSEARMAGENDGDEGSASHKHTNRLAKEHSPYLLQHAHNPVSFLGLAVIYLCLIETGMPLNMCFM